MGASLSAPPFFMKAQLDSRAEMGELDHSLAPRQREKETNLRKVASRSLILLSLVGVGVGIFVATSATASTRHKSASVQVCVLLPDTKSSVRWVQFDAPLLKAAFAKAGVTASIT